MKVNARYSAQLTAALLIVYLVWGSSYLASKIGVTHLPMSLFSGIRFIIAGCALILLARYWRQNRWPVSRSEWRDVIIVGLFTVLISNGLSLWSLHYISSTESALLNTTSALWIAGLGSIGLQGQPLTRQAMLALVLGGLGTLLTVLPRLQLQSVNVLPYAGTLLGSFAWSLSTIYYRHISTELRPLMFIGFQMLTGGIMQFLLGCALGQTSDWSFSVPGMLSLAYLTIFSSALAYTAYGWLTRNASTAVIGTYSYVNPAIAAFLGWLFLKERLLPIQFAGMLVTIVSVALVTLAGTAPDKKSLEEPTSP